MTKVGILSDTHGILLPEVLRFLESCDCLWHAGDIGNMETFERLSAFRPTTAVYGNIDDYILRRHVPETAVFSCEDCKVVMTHIGGYPNRYAPGILPLLQREKPDLFVAGHSHILKVMPDKKLGLMHFNPGAAGNKGFHRLITAIRMNIDRKVLSDLEIFETDRSNLI